MAGGQVDQALLQSKYQNAGDVYDDNKTEGAFQVVVDQVNANWIDYDSFKVGTRYVVDGGAFTDTSVQNTIDGGTFV